MEEKLRNLSQNIENNTGANAHKPEETPPPEPEEVHEEEHHEEEHHEEEHREEEHHDEEPREEERHDEEPVMDEAEENVPEPEDGEKVDIDFNPVKEQEQELEQEPESSPSRKDDSDSSEAKILSMDEEEPKESPTRTKKYSPEVEAALNRLNSEEAVADLSEPLSTEPKKKHHFGRLFLFILFILAIAAVALCVLVEQKIIDNPFPDLFKKQESSKVEPATPSQSVSADYLEIPEWGIKLEKPEGYDNISYTITDEFNLSISIANQSGTTLGSILLRRDFEPTITYLEKTVTPVTSISGYYYYFIDAKESVTNILENYRKSEHPILAL